MKWLLSFVHVLVGLSGFIYSLVLQVIYVVWILVLGPLCVSSPHGVFFRAKVFIFNEAQFAGFSFYGFCFKS